MTKRLKFELNKELLVERVEEGFADLFDTVTGKLSEFGIDIWIEDDEKVEPFVPGHLKHLHANFARAFNESSSAALFDRLRNKK